MKGEKEQVSRGGNLRFRVTERGVHCDGLARLEFGRGPSERATVREKEGINAQC